MRLVFRWSYAVSGLFCFDFEISWRVLCFYASLSSARADGERGAVQAADV